jgi:hypothetical protein
MRAVSRRSYRWLSLASLLGVAECGGHALAPGRATDADVGESPDGQATDAEVMAPHDGATEPVGAPGDCLTGLVTATELASTPRADTNLELLALKLSEGRVVADQTVYDRLVRDVGAIRAQRPDLATISYFPSSDGKTIPLTVDVDTAERMKSGSYAPWECLNALFGAVMPFEYIRIGNADDEFVIVKLKGLYAMDILAPEYGRLPGVISADKSSSGGDGPTICVTPGADTWHYVTDAASGDCPAGCIDHAYSHFTTNTVGAVMQLEEWSSTGGGAAPAWVAQYASLAACR